MLVPAGSYVLNLFTWARVPLLVLTYASRKGAKQPQAINLLPSLTGSHCGGSFSSPAGITLRSLPRKRPYLPLPTPGGDLRPSSRSAFPEIERVGHVLQSVESPGSRHNGTHKPWTQVSQPTNALIKTLWRTKKKERITTVRYPHWYQMTSIS